MGASRPDRKDGKKENEENSTTVDHSTRWRAVRTQPAALDDRRRVLYSCANGLLCERIVAGKPLS